jgi:hypothetical protein
MDNPSRQPLDQTRRILAVLFLLAVAVVALVVGIIDTFRHASLLAPAALGVSLVCSITAYVIVRDAA